MVFGQQSGPPASTKQVQELLALVQQAGYSDFRDARGAMHLTQRQASGKFTRDEVAAFISELEDTDADEITTTSEVTAPPNATTRRLSGVPSEFLAAELQRRGWTVSEP